MYPFVSYSHFIYLRHALAHYLRWGIPNDYFNLTKGVDTYQGLTDRKSIKDRSFYKEIAYVKNVLNAFVAEYKLK